MGRTLLKVAAVLLALLLILAATAPFLLKRFLPPEKVRALIAENAQKALGREVRLGDVQYSLLKGLTLKELALSEAPDFAAGAFAQVKAFNVKLSWAPLLQRKIVVDRVTVVGLRLQVVKRKDGSFNFSSIGGGAAPAGAPVAAPPAALPFELAVSRAVVSDGQVSYKDLSSGDEVALSGLEGKLLHFRLDAPFEAGLQVRAKGRSGGKPVDAALSFAGRVDLGRGQTSKVSLDVKKLGLETQGLKLEASGQVQNLDKPKLDVQLKAAAAGGPLLDASVKGDAATAPPAFKGDVRLKTAGFKTDDLKALGVPAGIVVPPVAVSGGLAYGNDEVGLTGFKLEGAYGFLEASGKVSALSAKPKPDLTLKGSLDSPALKTADLPWAKLPAGLTLPAAKAKGVVSVKGDDAQIASLELRTSAGTVKASGAVRRLTSSKPEPDLSVALELDLPSFKAADLAFTGAKLPPTFVSPAMAVSGSVGLKGDDLALAPLKIKAKEGTLVAKGRVAKLSSGAPQPELDVVAKLSLPVLKSADLPAGVPEGLSLPASSWDADVSVSLDEVRIKKLRLIIGKNDVEIDGGKVVAPRSKAPLFNILFKCRSFVLEELTQFSPQTRELGLKGSGFFAVAVTGKLPKPILQGKMQFKGLGATVSGLPLADFTGTASFDERRIDIPNLKGKVGDGSLEMDLTIKNYAAEPAVDLQASLDRFDLGQFFKAKEALSQSTPAPAASPEGGSKPAPLDLKGRFTVGQLAHPNAQVKDLRLNWDLYGVTPDFKTLDGSAQLASGGGKLNAIGDMATSSKLVKVLLFPFMIFQKIGRIGGIKLFPDFNNIAFTELAGDYSFQKGRMTLKDSHLYSDAANVLAQGEIDLPGEKLNMTVTAQVAKVAPMDVEVKGTFSQPETKLKLGKFLTDPAKNLIQGILKR